MLTLDIVKTYLRVDGNAEDSLIQLIMGAADDYVANAITNYEARTAAAENKAGDTWTQAVDMYKLKYIAHNYENRTINNPPPDRLLMQLQAQGRCFVNE